MTPTLYKELIKHAPKLSDLKQKYNPVLQLVDILVGTIPNSDVIMEIWPTSFRTYNLLVPNLLNLPFSLVQNKSVKQLVGLAMYQSSSAAGCDYCTAHSCSFALRRGIDESSITGDLSAKESAVVNFSRNMGKVPCEITKHDLTLLQQNCSPEEIEAVSMAVVLMGFLNKFMDVIGIELEQNAIDDVSDTLKETNWSTGKHANSETKADQFKKPSKDNFLTYLKVLLQAPGTIRLEKQWLANVPTTDEKIDSYLKNNIGHSFSVLQKLKKTKLKRVFTQVIAESFHFKNCHLPIKCKIVCGIIFSKIIENTYLKKELLALAKANKVEIEKSLIEAINSSSTNAFNNQNHTLSQLDIIAIKFTQKASTSPAYIDEIMIRELVENFSPESIVELTTWLAILQALHRLEKLPNI